MIIKPGVLLLLILGMEGYAAAATLSGSFAPLQSGAVIDLSAEGAEDWAHWGLDPTNVFDHKDSLMQEISDFTPIGGEEAQQQTGGLTGFTWSNGTPNLAVTNTTTSVVVTGLMSGFTVTTPADTLLRKLRVYVGVNSGQGRFQARLSDGSAPAYTDFSLDNQFETSNGVYNIAYAAASTGQVLTVTFAMSAIYDPDFASVCLEAASLVLIGTNLPPSVTLTSPEEDSNSTLGDPIQITADALDPDGSIASVEFYDGALKLDAETSSPYSFLWTNAPLGLHRLTAVARDNFGATATSRAVEIIVTTSGGL